MQELATKKQMMSSKRIAEKTGKRHDHVIRDIKAMIEELRKQEDDPNLGDGFVVKRDSRDYVSEFLLNERLSLCLASGYSISLRMKIIDDWAEMKANKEKPKELSRKEILLLTLEAEERAEKAEKTIAILTHVNKTYTTTELGKELGFKSANELNSKLHDLRIQYKSNDTWVLYSKYSNLAYIDIKQEVLENGKVIYHRRWTQLGREFLIKLFNL